MKPDKQPLYRKVNTRTHGVRHGKGGEAKWERKSKKAAGDLPSHESMHGRYRHGRDYTPLFKFLISKVGQDWDAVFSEALSRLDSEEPIFWLVARSPERGRPAVRTGESTWFSGLLVDEDNRLARVDPELTVDSLKPPCACCTHTFNGERFTQPHEQPESPSD